jgi:beta-N-acetylhexosaminidase
MSVEDKVGQLFLFGFDGQDSGGASQAITELRAGGIALLSNATSAGQAAVLTAGLQRLARDVGLPRLLIAVDHEGGSVQRIRGEMSSVETNLELGQMRPVAAAIAQACQHGRVHGKELAAVGIQVNLAPVVDVVDNPLNTVIGDRSYGSDPDLVAQLGASYIRGLQSEGVLGVAKHFPGHGSSTEDSHFTLPVVLHNREWIEGHELVPFRAAADVGVAAIMTAHVSFPQIDSVPDRPASLSPDLVDQILRKEWGYDGLVITDDMGAMEAITGRYEAGTAAVQAIQAGSDLLIVVGPIDRQRRMAQALVAAVGDGTISQTRLDESVRRVLRAKWRAGLLDPPPDRLSRGDRVCGAEEDASAAP